MREFRGTERFSLIRRLGAGGMGVVYEAHDRRLNTRVALKTLARVNPDAVHQIKSEFRIIAGLTHPNLVSLYELHAEDGLWFITMELVGGRGFREHVSGARPAAGDAETRTELTPVLNLGEDATSPAAPDIPLVRRSSPACDVPRLRAALLQLAGGINAIHAAGKLHRDLKPSNVLVTEGGRVVILDFGIAADLPGARQSLELTSLPYVGTPIYMSPERYAASAELTESADWYAVGVMLYEALTGRLPFRSTGVLDLMREKASVEPGAPSAVCDGIPPDLDALCQALLRRDPAARPSGGDIVRHLTAAMPTGGPPSQAPARSSATSVLVGRETTMRRLRDAAALTARGPVAVFLRGRSGMGKSAALQAYLDERTRDRDVVVLSGRCYENESVPFKALDALVDSLARYLRRLPDSDVARLLPRRADVLGRMFPALLRVPVFADAPPARGAAKDPVEERQIASAAFRDLVGRLTDRAQVTIAIDDLQWGDLDSAILLATLLTGADPPPILLIVAVRSEHIGTSDCLSHLRAALPGHAQTDIDLEPFGGSDVAALHAALHPEAAPIAPGRADQIAADAGGNPFIIREALEAGADVKAGVESVAAMIQDKVARQGDAGRRLVEIVSVSAKPLRIEDACEAAGVGGDAQLVLTGLRNARLIRITGSDDRETLETYHDRIRETIAGHLPEDRRRDDHAQLAAVLRRSTPIDPEHLAVHLEGAGETAEAAGLFASAAQQSSQALAFDHAVVLYERALRLMPGEPDAKLVARLAEALAEAGRSAAAADRFAEAARRSDAAARREYTRRAAYYYCISGRIDEGKAALGEVLGHFGVSLPGTKSAAIASVLGARARLWFRGLTFRPQRADALAPDVRERLDSLWAAAIGLGNTEVISGIGFSTRGLIQALDAGDPERIVRAMCWEACLRAVDDVASAGRLIEHAERAIRTCETPYLRGMILLARAIHAVNFTRWRDAIPLFDEAESLWLEHGHGVDWEVNTARHFCSWSLLYSGEYAEALRRMTSQQREATERGNLYMNASMGCYGEPLGLLAAGRPERARARRAEVMSRWTQQRVTVQHITAGLAEIQAALYEGHGSQAIDAARAQAALAHKEGFDRLALGRISTDHLILNSAFLTMEQTGRSAALEQEADRAIKRLAKETTGWGQGAAHGGRAGAAMVRGDRTAALAHLEAADTTFSSVGMTGFASLSRRQIGLIVGGERGRQIAADAEAWLTAHGVADPATFTRARLYVPFLSQPA
ncbi:MAG TPA: protein kinase [Vicinamibacterales bacterium]|nr:protein kinase [Vicinamibacterales bacterium]